MGLALVTCALILSGLVFAVCWLIDRIGTQTEDEPHFHMPYDERWCSYCHAIVDVDVYRTDAFTDISCLRCGESIDTIYNPGLE